MISSECNGCEYQCKLSHIDICTLGSPCPHQRSTPMTNEEWFDSLTTNEKAYHLADICAWAMEEFRCGNTEKANIVYWEKWLKQPHTIKEIHE